MNDIELRDHFAGQVLASAAQHYSPGNNKICAKECYDTAQAMINEKNRRVKAKNERRRNPV